MRSWMVMVMVVVMEVKERKEREITVEKDESLPLTLYTELITTHSFRLVVIHFSSNDDPYC